MIDWLLELYRTHELPGMFLFLLLEEAGLPLLLPGDTLIMAAGARSGLTLAGAVAAVATASVAATLGSSILYTLSRRGGRPLIARYGKRLHLGEDRVARLERWYRRHGMVAIVVGRLIPGLRTPTTVMAGLFGVPYRVFAPATAIAAVLWAGLYFLLGILLGRAGHLIFATVVGAVTSTIGLAVAAVAAASVAAVIVWRRRARRR